MTSNFTLKDPLQGVLPMTPDSANRSHPATMSLFFRKTSIPWLNGLHMVLHESKFEYLAYRTASSKLIEKLPFTAQWVHYSTPSVQDLTPASSVKYLGVHLSLDMKWSLQATIAAQNANKKVNWVLSAFSDRSKDVLLTLYKSIVRSRLEYSCPVWNPSSMLDIKKLESTQRAFTRYITTLVDAN